jgi:hypothetical protein
MKTRTPNMDQNFGDAFDPFLDPALDFFTDVVRLRYRYFRVNGDMQIYTDSAGHATSPHIMTAQYTGNGFCNRRNLVHISSGGVGQNP